MDAKEKGLTMATTMSDATIHCHMRSVIGAIRARLKLKTLVVLALPFVVMPLFGLLFGEVVMRRLMLYTAPFMVLPLVLKIIGKLRNGRSQ